MRNIELDMLEGPFPLALKRKHLPIAVSATCKCGQRIVVDLGEDFTISHPIMNGTNKAYLYCSSCNDEMAVLFQLKLQASLEEV
jgi:hypothetical protein